MRLTISTTTMLLASAAVARAHPGDHSQMAWGEAASHFATFSVHLPALLVVGGMLAGVLAWRLARTSAKATARRR